MPPYAFVPGHNPHPYSDPDGHSFGLRPSPSEPPDALNWRACRPYVYGLDLFNHGYYWEAHEVWEGLWHACGRSGITADFLKGLIQLAAAGVKVRQGQSQGTASHARRAAELFRQVERAVETKEGRYLGLSLAAFACSAGEAEHTTIGTDATATPVVPVFSFSLDPA